MSILLFLSFLGVLTGVVGLSLAARKQRVESERRLAFALQLSIDQPGGLLRGRGTRLYGRHHGVAVEVEYFQRSSGKSTAMYTRFRAHSGAFDVGLKPKQGLGETWRVLTGGQDYRVGDPAFDDAITVTGAPRSLSAMLDERARTEVLALLLRRSAQVSDGVVSYETRGHLDEAADVAARLDALAQVAAQLARIPSALVDAQLVDNMTKDPCPGVRLRCLQLLADAPDAAGIAQAALSDPDPVVRLQAALLLGESAIIAAAEPAHVLALAAQDPAQVVNALVAGDDEPALIRLLSGPVLVRILAARGLTRIGTVHAIAPLRPLTQGLLVDGEVVAAALAAIEAIQARLGDVGPGQLSMVEGESGAVSVAPEAGTVSVASAAPLAPNPSQRRAERQ